jgi:CheY-like chemotaxis protein
MISILLVDDDDVIRSSLEEILSRFGCRVVAARSGKEAIAAVSGRSFDAIITDVLMPDMDGIEVLWKLRQLGPLPRVVAMSGGGRISSHDCLAMAQRLGAFRILQKPFSTNQLLSVVGEIAAHCLQQKEDGCRKHPPVMA